MLIWGRGKPEGARPCLKSRRFRRELHPPQWAMEGRSGPLDRERRPAVVVETERELVEKALMPVE